MSAINLSVENFRDYQHEFTDFLTGGDSTFGSVEMGLGKTVCVLTAISRIIKQDREKGKLRRFLVVAPKKVVNNVWAQEAKLWKQTRHLRIGLAMGSVHQRTAMLTDPNIDIVCINYEKLTWLLKTFPRGKLPFYGLVLDEVDKMKAVDTARFRAFRYRAYEFPWRVGMTGTPTPENLHDIWGPIFLITAELNPDAASKRSWPPQLRAALGTSKDLFLKHYFEQDPYTRKVTPRSGTLSHIADRIADFTFQARIEDHLDLPELLIKTVHYDLPPEARKIYNDLEEEFVVWLDKYGLGKLTADEEEEGWDGSVTAVNGAVLKNKLRQVCSGFLYGDSEEFGTRHTQWIHGAKIGAYQDFRSELMGSPHLAVYGYHAEVNKIAFEHRLGKGVTDKMEEEILGKWDAGEIDTLAMHPASAGHGLNLHRSGAHHIAFLTLPWSRGLFDQTCARLRRMGQKNVVVVHLFVARGTVEEDVVASLEGKGDMQKQVVDAIRRRSQRAA